MRRPNSNNDPKMISLLPAMVILKRFNRLPVSSLEKNCTTVAHRMNNISNSPPAGMKNRKRADVTDIVNSPQMIVIAISLLLPRGTKNFRTANPMVKLIKVRTSQVRRMSTIGVKVGKF